MAANIHRVTAIGDEQWCLHRTDLLVPVLKMLQLRLTDDRYLRWAPWETSNGAYKREIREFHGLHSSLAMTY